MVSRVVVVGTGLGGASAAAELRELDFDGSVTLLGNSGVPPYELPPLSKDMLLGQADEPDWVREAGFYRDFDIDLRPDTDVLEVHRGERLVLDAAGNSYSYDALVLATGSRPRTLPVPGIELAGVRTLRTREDSLALRASLRPGANVVVLGAGWIGCEVAAAARTRGAEVTVVEPLAAPLLPVLGEQVADVFARLHEQHGVRLRFGTRAQSFTGDGGTVRAVRLDDGTELPADVVVLAVGAEPRTELGAAAGLELAGGGIAVDASLRTSDPAIYAVGDIAAQDHPRYSGRVRVEHWDNAKQQGEHVASVLLGEAGDYAKLPYFFSDQYDLGCEYRGLADPTTDELVIRGSTEQREFTAFWRRDGRVRAAMNVNQWDEGEALDRLVGSAAAVPAESLRDADLATLPAQ